MATKTRKKSVKKVEAVETTPAITLSLKLAGQDQELSTHDVLSCLRTIKIDRLRLKSPARFTFRYNGKEFMKSLTIPQTRRFVGNDVYKQIVAKWVNQNLGLISTP